MSNIILVGEPMALFTADNEGSLDEVKCFTKSIAGAEVNVSIGLTRLGHKVSYITKLGMDTFGRYIYNFIKKEGIDVSNIKFDSDFPTGFMLKSKVSVGDPEIAYFRKGSAASYLTTEDVSNINFSLYNHLHLTGIFPAISVSAREALYKLIDAARNSDISISFDPNLRPAIWESKDLMINVINDIASRCDIILPGINEGKILTGFDNERDIAQFYLNNGAKIVIIKAGDKGAYAYSSNREVKVDGFRVDKVIDTVGAGDGFAVGAISGFLEGLSLDEAVRRGNAIGAMQVMSPGDNDGLPSTEKLSSFIKGYKLQC